MSSRTPDGSERDVPHDTISRRRLLGVGGIVTLGGLAGCVNRVASALTNTGASPAAVFAGVDWNDDDADITFEMAGGGPHVSRLTPTVSGGSGVLSGEVELEGWVTSSAVMAQNYNASRSNKPRSGSSDEDSDGDGVSDADEADELLAYLGGNPIVAERFTVCLPDAEVPGGNGSIAAAVTPARLIEYMTGQSDGGGRVYSWGTPKSGPGDPEEAGDCDDRDGDIYPGAVCGTSPHLVADITGPTATGGRLEVGRASDGMVTVINTPPEADGGSAEVCVSAGDDPCGPGVWARASGSSSATGTLVYQVLVQPPECPHPFPALLYVQRCRSDDQLVYTGGWVVDEAGLYAESATVLTVAGETPVVGIECCFDYSGDVDGDGLGDLVERSVSGPRARRGARIDSGAVSELVESGVLSSGAAEGIRKRPGRRKYGDITLKHVAVDAPIFHLVSAARASRDVKFKAGAELSKSVN